MLEITSTFAIDEADLKERFVRADGPGGQNVNKVSTAVELRFDAGRSAALPEDARARLRGIAGKRMTADGVLVVESRRHRTQAENREDAREKLAGMIRLALIPPRTRRRTKPSAAAKKRRVEAKRRRSETKRSRATRGGED